MRGRKEEYRYIDGKKTEDGNHHILGHLDLTQLDGAYRVGMYQVAELQPGILEKQKNPDMLDAAAGGAGTAADEHQGNKQDLTVWRPLIEIGGAETGGGENRYHLKK